MTMIKTTPMRVNGDALSVATKYTRRGWRVLPIQHRQKKITDDGWQRLRLDEADLPNHFNGKPQNIGVLLGEPSGWLVDIDLDVREATELADAYLPPTDAVFGRAGNPDSHRLYIVTAPLDTKRFKGSNGTTLLEVRSTGCQTVFPGSTHESGERITWRYEGDPAEVSPDALLDAAQRLAEAVARSRGETLRCKPTHKPACATTSTPTGDANRAWRYIVKKRDGISGQSGHDATFSAACECFRFGLSDADAWEVMQRFNAEKCDPPWTDHELHHKLDDARARVDADGEHGMRLRSQSAPARSRGDSTSPDVPLVFDGPHGLTLTATDARIVGARGKVEVTFAVAVDGDDQAPVTCTSAATTITSAARSIADYIALHRGDERLSKPDGTKVQRFVAQVMTNARELAEHFKQVRKDEPREVVTGPTMQSIIIDQAPKLAGLAFRNNDGTAYSEAFCRNIDGREFERNVSAELGRACESAVDYPEDRIGKSAPVGMMRQYMLMAWSEAVRALPCEVKATTGPGSNAARRYADAIVRLFTIRERWRKLIARDGDEHGVDSATLAQLARDIVEAQPLETPSGWKRIHNTAIDAWVCTMPVRGDDGQLTGELPQPWLAFRYELVNQLPKQYRADLPNTRDQADLTRIANRYGLTADREQGAPVSLVKERGKQRRVIVLNRQLTDLILWQWDDGAEPAE